MSTGAISVFGNSPGCKLGYVFLDGKCRDSALDLDGAPQWSECLCLCRPSAVLSVVSFHILCQVFLIFVGFVCFVLSLSV